MFSPSKFSLSTSSSLVKASFYPHAQHIMQVTIHRLMPQARVTPVGAFVFLDHFFNHAYMPDKLPKPDGQFAHPHCGIATLSYLINGGIEHFDSQGQHGIIGQGGAQWMKAGTGIVHDELPIPHNNQFEGLQFWINLLPQGKAQAPDYRAVQAAQLPWFDYQGSQCKVIVGELAAMSSPIPTEQRLFLYHLQLQTQIILTLEAGDEIAVFSPKASIVLNDETLPAGLHILQPPLPSLTIKTSDEKMNDVFVFGGQPYNQPIVSGGPFMTNTQAQLQQAYLDFQAGKYGQMDYSGYDSE